MDLRALRISGIVVSGALIGAAAIFAIAGAPLAPAPATRAAQPAGAPSVSAPSVSAHSAGAHSAGAQSASAQSASAQAAFAISLRGFGPLARAQRLAMSGGRDAAAGRRVAHELARQRAFRGLCFQRFTPRGDIVVRSCGQGAANIDWRARLRAMPAVTNVDAASQLAQDQRGD